MRESWKSEKLNKTYFQLQYSKAVYEIRGKHKNIQIPIYSSRYFTLGYATPIKFRCSTLTDSKTDFSKNQILYLSSYRYESINGFLALS